MSSYIRRIALLTATVFLAACDGDSADPTSPRATPRAIPESSSSSVERWEEEWVSDFDGVFTKFFCEDGTETELVALTGQLYQRHSTKLNPTGTYTMTSHTMPIGLRGIGTETGHEYRVDEQQHYAVSQREVGYTGSIRQVILLKNRVTMETYKLVSRSHYVVTPNGMEMQRDSERWECGK